MRKKSLIGWITKNWTIRFDGGYLDMPIVTIHPITKPPYTQIKIRITIEQLSR